jgi:hypothetical protein
LDQKSERIQNLITQIMSNLLQIGNSYEIETPSFFMKHYIFNVSNNYNWPFEEISFQGGIFKLPPFFDLVNDKNFNCSSSNALVLKVKLFYMMKNR